MLLFLPVSDGSRLVGTLVSLLVDDRHIRVIHRHTSQLLRELIQDPHHDSTRGPPPGPAQDTPRGEMVTLTAGAAWRCTMTPLSDGGLHR